MMLLLAFAAASLGLAAIGIYALVLQTVTQRLPEVAVRLALGARAAGVAASLARSALVIGLVGLAAGAIGAAMLGRLWESMLYGVRATDAPVLAVAGGLLLGVTTLAALIPAFRATRIDPVRFLRG
jgi:putative ABC transport system permease protein